MKVIKKLRQMLDIATKPCGEIITYGLNKGAKGYEVQPLDSLCGGRVSVALEVMIPMPHTSDGRRSLRKSDCRCMQPLGWNFSVQDSRAEYATLDGAKKPTTHAQAIFLLRRVKRRSQGSAISCC